MSRRVLLGLMLAALAASAVAAGWAIADAGTGTALSVARAVRFVGIGAVTGLLVLVLVVWSPLRRTGRVGAAVDDAFLSAAAPALRGFALLGVVGSVAALALHAASATDAGALGALGTRIGAWYGISALAFAGLAAVAPAAVRAETVRTPPLAVALATLVVLNVAPALGGNAAVSSPAVALVPIEIVHVAAMGAWIGGLLALLLVLPHATRALPDGVERTGLLAAVLLRFTPVALVSVALLTLAGTGLSLLSLTTLYDLADTAYGRAVFVKVVVLLIVIAIAVLQREYLMPQLERAVAAATAEPGDRRASVAGGRPAGERPDALDDEDDEGPPPDPRDAARHVRTAMRSEALLLVVVLIVTGALAGYPPPKTLAGKPVSVVRAVDGLELRLVVEPARVGDNAMRLTVRGAGGQPAAIDGDVRVRAVPPGRAGSSDTPVDVVATPAGPGRWTAPAVPLGARGSWKFEVSLRSPAGPRVTASLPVRVR